MLGDMVAAVRSSAPSMRSPRRRRNLDVSKSVPLLDGINRSPSVRLGVRLVPPGVMSNRLGDLLGVHAFLAAFDGVFLTDSLRRLLPAQEVDRLPANLRPPDMLSLGFVRELFAPPLNEFDEVSSAFRCQRATGPLAARGWSILVTLDISFSNEK